MQGKNDKTHLASKLKMIRLGIEIEMKFSSSVNFNPKSFNFEFFLFPIVIFEYLVFCYFKIIRIEIV